MIKKQLCVGLCILILLSISNVVFAQQSYSGNSLRASYVKFSATEGGADLCQFPQTGTTVFASTDITNNDSVPQAALLWVGVYKDKVMVDAKFKRLVIPEGATQTFTTPGLTIKEGYTSSNTQIIAYVWTSFFNANSIAASANFLKDNGELKNIYINGAPLPDFHNSISQYTHYVNSLDKPVVTAEVTDNATKVEVFDFLYPGVAVIRTTSSSSGSIRIFQIDLKAKGTFTSFAKNPSSPKKSLLDYGSILTPVTSFAYTDRTIYPLTYIHSELVGNTLIRMPLNDVRCNTSSSSEADMIQFMNTPGQTYYTFSADMPGSIYTVAQTPLSNYTNLGWTVMNNGSSCFPLMYNGANYTDYNKINGAVTTEILPKAYNPTRAFGLAREQSGSVIFFRYVYKKNFNAGEEVSVPTPNCAGGLGTYPEGALWVIKWGQASN